MAMHPGSASAGKNSIGLRPCTLMVRAPFHGNLSRANVFCRAVTLGRNETLSGPKTFTARLPMPKKRGSPEARITTRLPPASCFTASSVVAGFAPRTHVLSLCPAKTASCRFPPTSTSAASIASRCASVRSLGPTPVPTTVTLLIVFLPSVSL